jgi:hypothetical protein
MSKMTENNPNQSPKCVLTESNFENAQIAVDEAMNYYNPLNNLPEPVHV